MNDDNVLDRYHYHEFIDRCSVLQGIIEDYLLNHPVAIVGDTKKKIDEVQSILSDIYDDICTEIDKVTPEFPNEVCPVLAEIESITDTGKIRWHEVVYRMAGNWRSYFGSETFEDGEKVIKWCYPKDCFIK